MPPATAISNSSSLSSIDESNAKFDAPSDLKVIRSAKETLVELISQVESSELQRAMKSEIKRLVIDHDRLVTMLQQRTQHLEHDNEELQVVASEHQRRYEKAVREMQFFRRKYDKIAELHKQMRPRSLSLESESSSGDNLPQKLPNYPLTPTSPQPSPHPLAEAIFDAIGPTDPAPIMPRKAVMMPSRSSSTSSSSSQFWPNAMPIPGPPNEPAPPVPRLRQNSMAASSVHSGQSFDQKPDNTRRKRSWQQGVPIQQTVSLATSPPINNAHAVPMTPVRSSTATNGYTGASMIQQRRVDPLLFGGSDGLWETIGKSKGSDVTVEKIIR